MARVGDATTWYAAVVGASRVGLSLLVGTLAGACSSPSAEPETQTGGTRVLADYALGDGFFAAPFPDDARLDESGHPLLSSFPNPTGSTFVDKMRELLQRDARGFSSTAGVFFSLDGPLDPAVEADFTASLADDARVFLMDIDAASPDRGRRLPVRVHFAEDGGPFGAPNLLALVPLQGAPLRPLTRYAAVVTREVRDVKGARLAVTTSLRQIIRGETPDGMSASAFERHRSALEALAELGVSSSELAGLAVFTTDDPMRDLLAVRSAMLAAPLPKPVAAFAPKEVFDELCVYESQLELPEYQAGTPPFQEDGGEWEFAADGTPIAHGEEQARIVVTMPRQSMPAAGFPVVIFSRTGGGGDRPLVDRGVQAGTRRTGARARHGPCAPVRARRLGRRERRRPARRPAQHDRRRRAVPDVQRDATPARCGTTCDNLRPRSRSRPTCSTKISIDASALSRSRRGGAPAKLDSGTLALMGHSMGATIAPLSLAIEPQLPGGHPERRGRELDRERALQAEARCR